MRTPRTVDEIADAILPPSIDGIHERALCLLLAEHEATFHALDNRCILLESRSYAANERLDALERCEPGEEGRVEGSHSAASAAAASQRAPGSTAPGPTANDVRQVVLWMRKVNAYNAAGIIRALAADRDRLAQVNERVERGYGLAEIVNAARSRLAGSPDLRDVMRDIIAERDALARRIEAMAAREPTDSESWTVLDRMMKQGTESAWRYVRESILATPASEPSEGLPTRECDCACACPDHTEQPCGCLCWAASHIYKPAPQPAPATQSAEDVEWWYGFIKLRVYGIGATVAANAIAAEVAKREAGLREELATARELKMLAQRDLATARAQLAAATEEGK